MSKPPTITIIGSLNTDLVTVTPRLPSPGETLISHSFTTGSGGKGANQAVACARLSRTRPSTTPNTGSTAHATRMISSKSSRTRIPPTIRMIGAVGDDFFGQSLLTDLRRNDINTDSISIKHGEKSGVAVIIVEEDSGENRILISPNANFSVRFTDEFLMSGVEDLPNLIILQLEIPLETVLFVLQRAKERGVNVLFNPAPAQILPQEAWESVTHLIVNENEAGIITGCTTTTTTTAPDWSQWGPHIQNLTSLPIRHVTITLGSKGVVYLDTTLRKVWRFPAEKVNVVDTTAAGDTFVGAYAVAVVKMKGREGGVESAVGWANRAAARTVGRRGAMEAVPWGDEVGGFEEGREGEVVGKGVGFEEWKGEGG